MAVYIALCEFWDHILQIRYIITLCVKLLLKSN